MSALAPSLDGARVLDLFAGSGALGLEALSRGARETVFVERAGGALAALRANVEHLAAGARCRIVERDALNYVAGLGDLEFDVALADPPYGRGIAERLIQRFTEVPFARELWVEHRTAEPIPAPSSSRQRVYGDTTLTTVVADA